METIFMNLENKRDRLEKVIKSMNYARLNESYTGFTNKCRKCGIEVKCTHTHQNEDNIACFEMTCNCTKQ